MYTLLRTAQVDQKTQDQIDLLRVEYSRDPEVQLRLDRRQTALNEARERNMAKITEIAVMN